MDSEQIQPQSSKPSSGLSSWPPIEPQNNPTPNVGEAADKANGLSDTLDGLASQTSYNLPPQSTAQAASQPADFNFLPKSNSTQTNSAIPKEVDQSNLSNFVEPTPAMTNVGNAPLNNSLGASQMPQNSQPSPIQPSNNTPQPTTFSNEPNTDSKPLNFNPPAEPKKKRGKLKYFLIILIALLVIGGAASAAYFGYVLPNKPENKLLSAIANTSTQTQLIIKGKVEAETKKPNLSYNVNYELGADLTKHNLGLSGTVGVKGLQFPFDIRYIDKDIYVKVGGLSSIGKLAPLVKDNKEVYSYVNVLSSISDQWYVIDSSLLNASPPSKCVTDLSWALTKDDSAKIQAAYKKHPLFSVSGVTTASIDGKTLTKYDLKPASDAEATAFANELNSLSIAENINKCMNNSGSNSTSGDQEINNVISKTTSENFYVYVSDNLVKRIELSSTDNNGSYSFSGNFDYSAPTIEKPTGAKPVQDLMCQVLGPLYCNLGTNSANPLLQ